MDVENERCTFMRTNISSVQQVRIDLETDFFGNVSRFRRDLFSGMDTDIDPFNGLPVGRSKKPSLAGRAIS